MTNMAIEYGPFTVDLYTHKTSSAFPSFFVCLKKGKPSNPSAHQPELVDRKSTGN